MYSMILLRQCKGLDWSKVKVLDREKIGDFLTEPRCQNKPKLIGNLLDPKNKHRMRESEN